LSVKFVSSADPKYLASGDILIGDMSDINYEYLLFNRPVILIANDWLQKNFPDIGIKTNLKGLLNAVTRSVENPLEFEANRIEWLNKTFNFPDGKSASRHILDIAIEKSGYKEPIIVLLHGGNITRESNIKPIYDEGSDRGLNVLLINKPDDEYDAEEVIYIAAHFDDLHIKKGYKVHLDHGLKGKGTANLDISIADYRKHNYFPEIDLHITAGPAGYERTTKLLLGPNKNRAVIGAYPKADNLLKLKTNQLKTEICNELDFDPDKKIVVYAPAGVLSCEKPGGSLSLRAVIQIYKLSILKKVNVIVKLKNKKHSLIFIPIRYVINILRNVKP